MTIPRSNPDVGALNHTKLNEKQELALFWIGAGYPHYVPFPNHHGRQQWKWFVGETEITSQVQSLTKRRLVRQKFGNGNVDLPTLELRTENVAIYNECMAQKERNKKIIADNDKRIAEAVQGLP